MADPLVNSVATVLLLLLQPQIAHIVAAAAVDAVVIAVVASCIVTIIVIVTCIVTSTVNVTIDIVVIVVFSMAIAAVIDICFNADGVRSFDVLSSQLQLLLTFVKQCSWDLYLLRNVD